MMKSIMLATAALAMTATVATAADRPTIVGYSEYAVEAETFELGTGAEFIVADRLIVTPTVIGFGTTDDFNFDRLEVKASYGLSENVDLYGKIKTDDELNYSETVIGASFQF